jgi:hypothetical protein
LKLSCCFAATPVPGDWRGWYCCILHLSGFCEYHAGDLPHGPSTSETLRQCSTFQLGKLYFCKQWMPFGKHCHDYKILSQDGYMDYRNSLQIQQFS